MRIEVSNGEVFDKITILEIKMRMFTDENKLNNVKREYQELHSIYNDTNYLEHTELFNLVGELQKVNKKLWDIEDALRNKEKLKQFDDEFIFLARSVYFTNDERAAIKKKINTLTNSNMVEEKGYAKYV